MPDEILLVLSTFPDLETARRIARELVTEKFAACANIVPHVESIYRWQGKLEEGRETLVLFKISATSYPVFETKLRSLHPYEVPEIVACQINRGLPEYLRWVIENNPPEARSL
jgi:periplasmic divalent cation tolerance protein